MQQPSAQGIASLYMGNPGALQQKVQKEQQAQPGLPPDLQELMALNIVTNEQDAAKRQQAMAALSQMAPMGGQPPTVAQSIQEQAKQKMQAHMLMQQRQQMAMQELAKQGAPLAGTPEQVPQPQRQPQGIDELPVNIGQFAGGGIVAFAGGEDVRGYETPYDRMNRENRERAEAEEAARIEAIRASGNEAGAVPYGEQMRRLGAAIDRVVPDPVQLFRRLVSDPTIAKEAEAAGADEAKRAAARSAINAAERRSAPDAYASRGLPAAAPAMPVRVAPAPVRAAPVAAPQSTPAAEPAGLDAAYQAALKDMSLNRDVRAAEAIARAREAYGAPDTSQYDRLVSELEARKRQFAAPAQGWDSFMEYMQQIAGAGPARSWYEAGAKGAAAQQALNKEREAQQFELTKQAIDIAQKKLDTERGYKKELFGLGEKERDAVDKQVDSAVKEYGLNQRQAAQLRNQLEVQALQNKGQLAAASIRAAAAGGGEDKQQLNELKALQTNLQNQLKTEFNKDRRAMINSQLQQVNDAIAKMAGLGTMMGAPGASSPGGTTSGWGKASVVK